MSLVGGGWEHRPLDELMSREPPRRSLDIDLTPYLGRWVAIVRGRVTGVGATATQARLASKAQREKEEPIVIFVFDFGKK